jgi:hypothetical protein
MYWLSVDPGITTGLCFWENGELLFSEASEEDVFITWLEVMLIRPTALKLVVIEEFRLYGHKANAQIGSDMPVAQLIGVIKYLCKKAGIPVVLQSASYAKTAGPVAMKALDVKAPRLGPHVKDAYLHGIAYYYWKGDRECEHNRELEM